jgi:hypothetical protein
VDVEQPAGLPSLEAAEALARDLLGALPDRWAHVQAVAARAAELTGAVASPVDQHVLVVSAWWHDLGYSPDLRRTGCHQIDGASYLASNGYPARICALVAHHSAAIFEAEERGLQAELNSWPSEDGPVADALWMADMTTGPRGERFDYSVRLAEILRRYPAESTVARAMRRAEPSVRQAIARTERRLKTGQAI